MMAYLYGPIAAILLSNIIFFVLTAVRLHRARMDTAFATKNRQNKQK
jgi:G protein-coupled receptor Mth (Methuselah protein)